MLLLESIYVIFYFNYAGRTQDSISIWPFGHATQSGAKDALGTEERLGTNGFLHIVQG